MNCQYKCAITRNGTRCYCGDGYETSRDGRSCTGKHEIGCNSKGQVSGPPCCCFGALVPAPQQQVVFSYWKESVFSQTGGGGECFPLLSQSYRSFVRAALQTSLPGDPVKLAAFRLVPIKSHLDQILMNEHSEIIQLSWECYFGIINCRLKWVFFSIFEIYDFLVLSPGICFLFYFFSFYNHIGVLLPYVYAHYQSLLSPSNSAKPDSS